MSANIVDAVIKLAAIKQLDQQKIQDIILESISSTLEKRLSPENELNVGVEKDSGAVVIRFKRQVVDIESGLGEISLADARAQFQKNLEIGDWVTQTMELHEFEPKLVKTAQKLIQDRIRHLEDEKLQNDYDKQKNTIVSGRIKSVDDVKGYRVDIGYTDALLPPEEQIEGEYYKIGDIVKAYVVSIRPHQSNVTIILSRSNAEFVKKLFEAEIPEIFQGKIKIRKIVREPGIRTKVELETTDPKHDPVSACIGVRGTRIDNIRKELHGEQIDIVVYDEDPELMVVNALGISKAERVSIERNRTASVVVSDDDKVVAIGRQGKNVKLAAKLTGLKIDIYTPVEFEEKMARERRTISHITELDGVTAKIAEILRNAGYTSVQDVFAASVEELCSLEGMGQKTVERLKEAAKFF